MAPSLAKDMEEVKLTLNVMSEELSKVLKQQTNLMRLIGDIQQLKAIIKEKDEKIEALEKRVEDLEQYTRMDDVVISGLKTTHRTYARITTGDNEGEDAPPGELLSLEQQVIEFFSSKDISLDKKTIAACYVIPQKKNASLQKQNKRPNIILRFVGRKYKIELLKVAKKTKGYRCVCERTSNQEECRDCTSSKDSEERDKNTGYMDQELQNNDKT